MSTTEDLKILRTTLFRRKKFVGGKGKRCFGSKHLRSVRSKYPYIKFDKASPSQIFPTTKLSRGVGEVGGGGKAVIRIFFFFAF